MRLRPPSRIVLTLLLAMLAAACDGGDGVHGKDLKIVLIGGAKSEAAARHDYANGVALLKTFLGAAPETRRAQVEAYPAGWPDDPSAFDGASTVVLYFDGLDKHPLRDQSRRQQFAQLMQRGVGVVVLHQASTVPVDDDLELLRWFGGVREGMFDRTTETTTLEPSSPAHPVSRGVTAFRYRDEFYPTLRFADAGVTPVLTAVLHVQYRDGSSVVEDIGEESTVAWAYERAQGGRSFGFTGAHYLLALDQPMLRKTLLNAILWTAGTEVPEDGVHVAANDAAAQRIAAMPASDPSPSSAARQAGADAGTFHADARRSGWHSQQTVLTRKNVSDPTFGLLWESPQLDSSEGQPPRLYATPLYLDRVRITAGEHEGENFSAVFAASNGGYVYAINAARAGDVPPGRVLWRTHLAPPCRLKPAPLDAVPTGVLSTPVIDAARGRLYVTSCDPKQGWQAYALDLGSGKVLGGWPVRLDEARLNQVNRNAGPAPVAPTRRFDFRVQRGALNLNPDGSRLYVTFGETETGWLVAVDTNKPQVDSAFAAVAMPHRGSGGIWGAGGAAVDEAGYVYVVTGSGFNGFADQSHDWTQSVLKLSDHAPAGLKLEGTYTPFNHCASATMDIDLGSGGAALLPDVDSTSTSTPRLLVVGGKQGNAYLLDRDRLPGRLDHRPPCSVDAASDRSLLSPRPQPQFAGPGPLNVFGPYSETDAAMDIARARSVPASFRAADGAVFVYLTGTTKTAEGSAANVAPSLARLRIVTAAGKPAYLEVDRLQNSVVLHNPGSPIVSSSGPENAIVWVLDQNAPRSALLSGPDAPAPVLYAFDATTLRRLWNSAPGELPTSGKYNQPNFAGGAVVVGTDRVQAFGPDAPVRQRAAAAPAPAAGPSAVVPTVHGRELDAAAIYEQRCAACHDYAQGNIPPRALIAARSHDHLVAALTHGTMRQQAAGLNDHDIDAVARYLKQ